MSEVLPLITFGATLGATFAAEYFLDRKYDIRRIYEKEILPMISEAAVIRNVDERKEKLREAYQKGLEIINERKPHMGLNFGCSISRPKEVKECEDYLKKILEETK